MTKCFFITGTDTNIGKTLAACALLQAMQLAGQRVVGYKPVASGCNTITSAGAYNSDALALLANSNVALTYHQVNPLAFLTATSPHLASRDEGYHINIDELSTGLQALTKLTDWLVIEGAGGWFTPLNDQRTIGDWVTREQLPVIMVVGMKIGCLNHALLTALAVRQAGLRLAGWIANYPSCTAHRAQDYLDSLKQRLRAPLLGQIPWLSIPDQTPLADYLDLSWLD